ncbi:macro domain-containing protein [Methylobacterium sp. CM6241]
MNTVNCVGVMGKGIAAEFKRRYPSMFADYKKICDKKLLEPGKLWLWQGPDQWVLNFPTKNHWRKPSSLEWIALGLEKFASQYERKGIHEISFPRLGCGNGGLDWEDVRPLMEKYLHRLPITVFIHDHSIDNGQPEHLEGVVAPTSVRTFDGFFQCLRNTIEIPDADLFSSREPQNFKAHFNSDRSLFIDAKDSKTEVSQDDLHGIWIGLLNGLVTRDMLTWSAGSCADELMDILKRIPGVQPVQVQNKEASNAQPALLFRLEHTKTVAA